MTISWLISTLLYAVTSWQMWSLGVIMFYTAFQLHFLPERLARVAARLYFYPTWPLTYLSRRKNYWTLVDSHVFVGAAPMSFMPHVDALVSRGVRAVINLCDEYAGPEKQYRRHHIQQLRLPTVDHSEPSLAALEEAVAFIKSQKQQGVRTYVHCKGGTGRSAAVVLCWLVASREMTPREAQNYLNEKRHVRKFLYLQPNILAFCNKLLMNKRSIKEKNRKFSSHEEAKSM
ncbi:phosphatidylinositol phosphatase [Plasmopara halstedii]|uniref:Phosphatidylinositol phosphatase n=1 Tax=Plasmopara halstedii TaxID=4781 RepID=A0A0P1B129_PLAHL|nr:phosphatidylinositol phosphatase [Plasmopara halstedii]CEG47650.1 phosphatidylinositol phosphatase [Plasmopara halstedii]|eukprot:XP_024584019.1 phosphatidylinositol phosphatase [Plasmopara halstedii]